MDATSVAIRGHGPLSQSIMTTADTGEEQSSEEGGSRGLFPGDVASGGNAMPKGECEHAEQ